MLVRAAACVHAIMVAAWVPLNYQYGILSKLSFDTSLLPRSREIQLEVISTQKTHYRRLCVTSSSFVRVV